MTDPDGGVTSYQYDSANRLTQMTNQFNETTGFVDDALGRLVRQDNANGTYSTWSFNAAGQASQVHTRKSDDTIVLSMAYARDNVGNPTQITDQLLLPDNQTWEAGSWTFGYDNIDRLTLEKRTGAHPYWYEYTLDGAGNRTQFVEKDQPGNVLGTTNATYSADNRLLTYGNTSYTWDQNGNQLTKTTNQVTVTMGWDYDNKLVSLHDGATMGFTYNADGLRQSKTVDGATTHYLYDGVRLLQETNAGGAIQTTYTLAPTGGEWHPLVSDRASGASRWYAFDALGTTRALTDHSQLTTHQFTDDAWGNVLSASDATAIPHQYVGRLGYYLDGASGLQLLTQRYYDPGVGRFVSEDPATHEGNWFAYGKGAGTNVIDPSGLWTRTGSASCDLALGSPPKTFCNAHPNNPACPKFWRGMTGAWPHVFYDWDKKGKNCRCKYKDERKYQDVEKVECGDSITVKKGTCSVTIRIIDVGPAAWTGNLVDLHPTAARKLYKCLYGKDLPDDDKEACKEFGKKEVTTSG